MTTTRHGLPGAPPGNGPVTSQRLAELPGTRDQAATGGADVQVAFEVADGPFTMVLQAHP